MTDTAWARWAYLIAALAGALVWVLIAITPPAPLPATAPPALFSAMRAFADVEAVARAPHPAGSAEDAKVRAYLAARLTALGAEVSEQPAPLSDKAVKRLAKWIGPAAEGTIGHNVVGLVKGRDPALPALVIMAHHDSVMGSPGAADDTIGVAAALETLRALKTGGQPQRDVIILFTDSEELGLDGAVNYFADPARASHIGVIMNMEARGTAGRANMFETGRNNGGFMRDYAALVARPATNSLSVLIYELMPNSTDYTIAKDKGIAGFNFAPVGGAWGYHSPLATPAALDKASLQDMGDQVLALSRHYAFARALPPRQPSAVFADVMGRVTILYPAIFGWVIVIVAAALIGVAIWRMKPAPRAIGGGAIITVALLSHSALFLTALNAVSGSADANYYDRLAALPRLEIQAALIVAALLLIAPMARRREIRLAAIGPALALMWVGLIFGGPMILCIATAIVAGISAFFLPRNARGAGPILCLLGVTIVVQAFLPTAAPLFAWPLLLAAIGMAGRAFLPPLAAIILTMAVAMVGLGHLAAQAHFIFLGVGAELPLAMVAVLFPALPLLWPLLPAKSPVWLPAALLVAALAMALWIRLDPIAPSVATYSVAEGGRKTKA